MRAVPPRAFRLWGKEYAGGQWSRVLIGVAGVLYERHPEEFRTIVGSPRGKRSYVETDESLMRASHRIGSSPYFVGCHANAQVMKKRWEYLLELLGYSSSDLELIFD